MMNTFSSVTQRKVFFYLATLGAITALAILAAAAIGALFVLGLAVSVFCQVAQQISTLYNHSDHLTQLLMLALAGIALWKIGSTLRHAGWKVKVM